MAERLRDRIIREAREDSPYGVGVVRSEYEEAMMEVAEREARTVLEDAGLDLRRYEVTIRRRRYW